MMISARPVMIARPASADDLSKAVEGASKIMEKTQAKPGAIVSLASGLTTPFELWDVGKAAVGAGEAGPALQVLGGVHCAIGAYKSVRGLMTNVTPQAVNDALKEQNGGRDLAPADAQNLAKKINGRARLNSTISLGNYAASGAAIATGNMAAGLVAIALKIATVGSAIHSSVQTVKDIQEVLRNQPPAPAPQPAPTTPNPAPQP